MSFTKLFSSVRFRTIKYVGAKCYSSAAQGCGKREDTKQHSHDHKVDHNKKGLIVGVYRTDNNEWKLTPKAEELNAITGGAIMKHVIEGECFLTVGKAVVVTDPTPEYSAVAIAMYGAKNPGIDVLEALDLTKENIRWGVGAAVTALQLRCVGHIVVETGDAPAAAAEAAFLAAWRFQQFKTANRWPEVILTPLVASPEWSHGEILAIGQNWARFLSDMPANVMTPIDLAQAAIDVLCALGVTVTVRDQEWIEAQNMQAFLTVAKGACTEPMFLECSWQNGNNTRPPILIAAKGVTFDSGGLCLKKCDGMYENRGSMAGAAVTLGALRSIALAKAELDVRVVIPICENMISGQCMKVGDVVRALNGMSIQIEDTDLEGRLMMADALVYGQAQYKPGLVIDVATLTKGTALATGGGAFGCFTTDDIQWHRVREAGCVTGDRGWRLPLWNYYRNQITNEAAFDLRNKGSGMASACIGAAFLKHFICTPWVHMDITGVGKLAHGSAPPYLREGRMTGRPTRTLTTLLYHYASGKQRNPDEKHTTDCHKREEKKTTDKAQGALSSMPIANATEIKRH